MEIAVFQTTNQPSKMGFIICLNEWENRDISDDRMIEMKNGIVRIHIKKNFSSLDDSQRRKVVFRIFCS